ncbi:MAG: hypothetical protein HYV25_00125 [Candidatus Harrisonbacteria bacterium]|nr:hypothetical protein [Candidatus Harrisonbacteria bacterium]
MADIGPVPGVGLPECVASPVVRARVSGEETHCVSNVWADTSRNAVVCVPKGTVCQVLLRDGRLALCYLRMRNGTPIVGWINRNNLEEHPLPAPQRCTC